ncbi:MAG: DUF3343 domain-containing protein [Coriobacteriales bacterium]
MRDAAPDEATGLFLFDRVQDALRGEKVLEQAGHAVALVAPPMRLRAGCDLALALPRVEYPGAARQLQAAGVSVRDWIDDPEEPTKLCDIVTTVDFGDHVMVRAGNMKITVEKATGTIVNTSGGGCPDIPYLNLQLVGREIFAAPRPKDLGFALCGLMLDRAFVEACALLGGEAR